MNLNKPRLNDMLRVFSFWLILILVAMKFLALALSAPLGTKDSYAIWNLRARFISNIGVDTALYGDNFDTVFSPVVAHADYPPLLPILVAGSWRLFQTQQPAIPIGIALLFAFATVGVLYYASARFKLSLQAWLLPLLLLVTPHFTLDGTRQVADIPLAFFILCAVVFLTLYERTYRFEWSVLSGASAGLALLTKNEGSLFVICLAAAAFPLWRSRSRVLGFVLGVLPFAVLLVIFKLSLEASNDLVAGQGPGTLDRLGDLSRYRVIFQEYAINLRWYVIASLIAVAFLAMNDTLHLRANLALRVAALMLIGYFVVYVITPKPLLWHLQTSLPRLILHVWPTLLFGYGLLGLRPAESLDTEEVTATTRIEPLLSRKAAALDSNQRT